MKLLVLNPEAETQANYKMINFEQILRDLLVKIFRQDEKTFSPVVFTEKHARMFVANVEPKIIAVSKYSGKQLNTFAEAVSYLNEIGKQIYGGRDWKIKLLKTEVLTSKATEFGVVVPSEDGIKTVLAEFDDPTLVTVVVKRPIQTKNQNQNTEQNEESEN